MADLRGEIVSCSGWKLNNLPEVRKFLKVSGHADIYKDLEVIWVNGKAPTLIIYDDDEELKRINLERYNTQQLHDLVEQQGFVKEVGEDGEEL